MRLACVLVAVALGAAGCATAGAGAGADVSAPTSPTAGPAGQLSAGPEREPYLRVGLGVDLDSVIVEARGGLRVRDLATGREMPEASDAWRLLRAADGIAVVADGDTLRRGRQDILLQAREPGAAVRIDGRSYRGGAEVLALPGRGLVAIDRVPLEAYLRGVVPLEIGVRGDSEVAAVEAQAVAARTYALANLGRRDSLGFDVFGTVQDQAYGGLASESPETSRAVAETAGQVLTWRGSPIRAYYHADDGGHTAAVHEVWNLPDAPYLRSVPDRRPDGSDWASVDPKHRWKQRWSSSELRSALAKGLSDYYGGATVSVGPVERIRIVGRTRSGRVAALVIRTVGGRYLVQRNDIRFVLLQPDGRVLRSTLFDIVDGPGADGGLVVRGRGNGHGVGMSQWGAIGRARAGEDYLEILQAYYPGTTLRRAYPAPEKPGTKDGS